MELIFSNLVIYRYNKKQAENVVRQCDEWFDDVKPDYLKDEFDETMDNIRNLQPKLE